MGVGNLWRFPYLAAKDGGGLFLLVYLVLVLTFGFTLLTSDIAIGRRTKQSAIRAYETMRPKWKFLGMQRNGETFRRKKLYRVMIRYVAPVMMLVLFLQSTGILA